MSNFKEVENPSLENLEMVGVRGFEPPASASRRRRSTRLSYTPRETLDLFSITVHSDEYKR